MKLSRLAYLLTALILVLKEPSVRDERGLSQSAENAILIAGAVGVAATIVAVIRAFVVSNLPS